MNRKMWIRPAVLALLIAPADLMAQTGHVHPAPDASPAWTWSWDANLFFGMNYQRRKFSDFRELESQNWLMGSGERAVGKGSLRLHAMLSFEPFTIQPLGSPQVFQTGETYQSAKLVDYQHPHDLFMSLSARWTTSLRAARVYVEAGPVASPALGPRSFMHRPSAAENPTAPLGHHQMDAAHITHGVITGGFERDGVGLEGSWFRGAEPDENRKDIDFGPLDSFSGRLSWRRDAWDAQISAAHLTSPELLEPGSDVTRLTASIGYTAPARGIAALLAWGQNRELHGVLDAFLFEGTWRPRARHAWYTRAELTTKDMNGGGQHPVGFEHFHVLSRVGALTGGYVWDAIVAKAGRFGLGGDVTVYHVPANLVDNYGSPASFHVFLRYRPREAALPAHAGH